MSSLREIEPSAEMENEKSFIVQRLRLMKREEIEVSEYAKRRAAFRQIDLEDVYDNLLNPVRLQWVQRQEVNGEERFNCYFVYKRRALRCVIKVEEEALRVINVIKQRKWPV